MLPIALALPPAALPPLALMGRAALRSPLVKGTPGERLLHCPDKTLRASFAGPSLRQNAQPSRLSAPVPLPLSPLPLPPVIGPCPTPMTLILAELPPPLHRRHCVLCFKM
jgi:hypothetical protein